MVVVMMMMMIMMMQVLQYVADINVAYTHEQQVRVWGLGLGAWGLRFEIV